MSRKEIHYQGLADLEVFVDDTSALSPNYFRVTKLPTELTAGINTLKFKGNPSLFPEGAEIFIEILDANGEPIYYEVDLDLESIEQPAIVSIFITPDIPSGNGTVIICGTAQQAADGTVLDPSDINVRWQTPIYIDSSKRNEDDIIFNTPPSVTVTANTGSVTEVKYLNFTDFGVIGIGQDGNLITDKTQEDTIYTATYLYNNDTPLIVLSSNSYSENFDANASIGNAYGEIGFISSSIDSAVVKVTNSYITSITPEIAISSLESAIVTSSVDYFTGSITFTNVYDSYPGVSIAYLKDPITFKIKNSNSVFYPTKLNLSVIDIIYTFANKIKPSGPISQEYAGGGSFYMRELQTENTFNLVTASFSGLQPQVGTVSKIRSYYKSTGVNEYVLANETDISSYSEDFGFTSNALTASFFIPTIHRNENVDFKFEFVNPNGLVAKQYVEVKDTLFKGGNTYIDGNDNLMTGSLYIAGATGAGVHLSGKNNASMIRSIGYTGFRNALSGSGKAGFVLYSGSISQSLTSAEHYAGVGLELVANSASYFKYTTSGSGLLDIRTKNFFLGDPSSSYISGSGGILAISSSNFQISPQGDVSITGDINATTGIFQNINVTGRIPSASFTAPGVYTGERTYLLEPWFTSSAEVDRVVTDASLSVAYPYTAQNLTYGTLSWRRGSDIDGAGVSLGTSGVTASMYYGGNGVFDDISGPNKIYNYLYRKWGDINETYSLPEYNGYLSESFYNPQPGERVNSIDTVIFRVGNNGTEYSITSNTIYLPLDIINLDDGIAKALTVQFSARFGNKSGFKDVTALGINPTFYAEILDASSNVLYSTYKIQNNIGEWLQFNIPITNLLLSSSAIGVVTATNTFKIRLRWLAENNGASSTTIEHVRISELRILQLPDVEGIRASTIQFQDSYISGDVSSSIHSGHWIPASNATYDLGSISNKKLWRTVHASALSGSLNASNAVVNSSLNVLTGPTRITGSLLVSGSTRITGSITTKNSSVGINTNNPQYPLDVFTTAFVGDSGAETGIILTGQSDNQIDFYWEANQKGYIQCGEATNGMILHSPLGVTIGNTATGITENTLTLSPAPAGGTGEGGQLGLMAKGSGFNSASFIDNWQNQFRILRGSNAGSNAGLMYMNLGTGNTQFIGAVTASAYSGLPNAYLYASRSGTNQTIGSGTWANRDIIFNSVGANTGITYNTSTGIATLLANKVYRITALVSWSAAATYVLQHQIYNQTTSGFIGPVAEIIQAPNGSFNASNPTLDYIFAVGASNTDISIRTTASTNALTGESIRYDLNTSLIIQQIA